MFTQPINSPLRLRSSKATEVTRKYSLDDNGYFRAHSKHVPVTSIDDSQLTCVAAMRRNDINSGVNSPSRTCRHFLSEEQEKTAGRMHPDIGISSLIYMVTAADPALTPLGKNVLYRDTESPQRASLSSPILMAVATTSADLNSATTAKNEKSCPSCFPKNENEDSGLASSESMSLSDCFSADRDEFSFSECMSSYNDCTVSSDLTHEELFDKQKGELDERRSNEDIDDFADEEVRTITNFDLGDNSPPSGEIDDESDFIEGLSSSPENADKGDDSFPSEVESLPGRSADGVKSSSTHATRSCLIDYRSYKRTPFNRVTFADARGFELEKIRYLTPPNDYLSPMMSMDSLNSKFELLFLQTKPRRILIPLFDQPNSLPSFLDKVLKSTVTLEYAFSNCLSLYGSVRIKNVEFEKNICIRYTIDGWNTIRELKATYSHHHDENDTDSFSFYYNFSIWATSLRRIEFAVRYTSTKGEEIWDNNGGKNYALLCKCS